MHGGPEARDWYGFRREVQMLASRGYRVVQPYFRGSSGRGRSFAEAGYGEWGGVMQNDVTDAIHHWQSDGRGSPEQTCIMGGSYGGYAALYAGGTTPELVSCVISTAGVSDMVDQMNHDRNRFGPNSESYAYWVKSVGDPSKGRDKLRAISPIRMVDAFDDPVFLAHGERDATVPVEQSRMMHKALKRAGKPVQYHEYELEGHRNWEWENYIDRFEKIDAFLRESLQ